MIFRKSFFPLYHISRSFKTNNVRVRFAPSPTGYLHLGGLRTALYNFLFAKSKNGKFILRIEDTDQSRLVPGAAEMLKEDLIWAGIEIDEGPNIGGDFGPYQQSERLNLYQEQVQELLKNRTAYHCFCTERRLDLLRREALKNREVPKYDNKCRNLSEDEVNKKFNEGLKPCVRFKLSSDVTSFNDLILGNLNFDVSQQEGDPVIIKTDGYPTYHFANVVDDHFMKITHVLRGVEWQISTTKHLLLYRAFNWKPPEFGHLPLLLNSDGTKLSKRQNDIKIKFYRENGIFPLALLNFTVNAGGGFEKDSQQNVKTNLFTIDELAEQFDLGKLNKHSGKLMPEKLSEFNKLEMKRILQNPIEQKRLIRELKEILRKHFKENLTTSNFNLQIDDEHILFILNWSLNRIEKLTDLISNDFRFIWIMPENLKLKGEQAIFLEKLHNELENQNDFDKNSLSKFLRNFAEEKNLKYNMMMKTLRSALSGLKEGPSVAEMMEILGKNTTIHRLKMCVNNNGK